MRKEEALTNHPRQKPPREFHRLLALAAVAGIGLISGIVLRAVVREAPEARVEEGSRMRKYARLLKANALSQPRQTRWRLLQWTLLPATLAPKKLSW
jgi:hypothetical protein